MAAEERQWAIERFVTGIDELKMVLGQETTPAIDRVKSHLIAAAAARDDGKRSQALESLARAMIGLAELGDRIGGAEGAMMRAVTAAFLQGLAADDREAVERNLALIESHAGTPKKEH